MRKLLLLSTVILIHFKIAACVCAPTTLTNQFLSADFVAIVEIKETYKNEKDKDYYKVDLEIEKLYKGDSVNSIDVGGYNQVDNWSSCDITLIKGSRWLIFGSKSKQGNLITGMCSVTNPSNSYFKSGNGLHTLEILKKRQSKLLARYPYIYPYIDYQKYKTYASGRTSDHMLVEVKLDTSFNVLKVNFLTDDTRLAKERVEAQIKNSAFLSYLKKRKFETNQDFYYIIELQPYTNSVEATFNDLKH